MSHPNVLLIYIYYLFTVCKVCLLHELRRFIRWGGGLLYTSGWWRLDLMTHEMGLGAAESIGEVGRFVW